MALHSISAKPNGAYVYAIIVDGVVRYIGKGSGKRVSHHVRRARAIARRRAAGERIRGTRFYSRLMNALAIGALIEERILSAGLTEEEAFTQERAEITAVGLAQLWNTNDGGIGPTSEDQRRLFRNPEHRKRHKAALNTPEALARKSAATAAQWADPVVRARKLEALKKSWDGAEDRRKKASEQSAARMSSAEVRAEHSKRLRTVTSTPEARAKKSVIAQGLAADPEHCAKLSAAIKQAWRKPGALERKSAATKARWADAESRAKLSAAIKAAKSTPEARAKASAQMKAVRARQREMA